jgi:FixJ family two-component response regulator
VLEHIIAGLQTRSIAAELDVAAKTIEAHRSHMMHKLEAESVVEVVRMHCILNAPLVTPGTRSRSG